MNQLLLLIAGAFMVGAAIFNLRQAIALRKINKMLAAIVAQMKANPPWKDEP